METIKTSPNVEFDVIYADGTRRHVREGVLFEIKGYELIFRNGTDRATALMKEAADIIEALEADMKLAAEAGICDICRYSQTMPACADSYILCDNCPYECVCKNCRNNSLFEWRGVQKGGQNNGI